LANNDYPWINYYGYANQNTIDTYCKPGEVYTRSSHTYPKLAPQPLKEEYLLRHFGTDQRVSVIAKITGVKVRQSGNQFNKDYVSLMPTNLYGTHDNLI
jgi:GDP-L-fucose synthase